MSEPYKLTLKDHKGNEVPVVLDADKQEEELYINIDGKEVLLPLKEALKLSIAIGMFVDSAREDKGNEKSSCIS
jgi:hypothetical protein